MFRFSSLDTFETVSTISIAVTVALALCTFVAGSAATGTFVYNGNNPITICAQSLSNNTQSLHGINTYFNFLIIWFLLYLFAAFILACYENIFTINGAINELAQIFHLFLAAVRIKCFSSVSVGLSVVDDNIVSSPWCVDLSTQRINPNFSFSTTTCFLNIVTTFTTRSNNNTRRCALRNDGCSISNGNTLIPTIELFRTISSTFLCLKHLSWLGTIDVPSISHIVIVQICPFHTIAQHIVWFWCTSWNHSQLFTHHNFVTIGCRDTRFTNHRPKQSTCSSVFG